DRPGARGRGHPLRHDPPDRVRGAVRGARLRLALPPGVADGERRGAGGRGGPGRRRAGRGGGRDRPHPPGRGGGGAPRPGPPRPAAAPEVGRGGRIVVSSDGGDTWRPAADGIETPMPDMVELFVVDPDGAVWAICSGGRLLSATPGEWRWQPAPTVAAGLKAE